jgi:nucleotide-binding universal stress UspA family protein
MYQSVLVPLDRSARAEGALDTAAAFACASGADLRLLAVAGSGVDAAADETWLGSLAASRKLPPTAATVVRHDSVADAILRAQDMEPDTLLCMATHARSGPSEVVLGSVAAEVVRRNRKPMLLLGPHATCPRSLGTVVVCLDGSPAAEQIIPTAAAWAHLLRGHVWLVRVDPPHGPVDDSFDGGDLRQTAGRIGAEYDVAVDWEVLHGRDVAGAIDDFARRLPASLVALTTHGRSSVAGRLLGSVALRVTHDATCPILLVRADGSG